MRWRLVAVLVGIVVLVLAAHDIPLAGQLRRVERDRVITALERDAFTIAGRSAAALADGADGSAAPGAGLGRMIEGYQGSSDARVVITDTAGTAVVSTDDESIAGWDFSSRPEIAAALEGAPASGERDSETLGTGLVYVAVPVFVSDDVVGAVRITYPASDIEHRVDERMRSLLLVAVTTVGMAAIVALVVSGTVTRPLRALRVATERFAGGDMTTRASTTDGPPEIRDLATAFNRMSERTQRLVDGQRSFAGDASHQLRTPLTALRLRLEQAVDRLDTDPDGARERLDAAGAETERLQHVIDGLLALARADGETGPTEPVDVSAVVNERVGTWRPLAEESGVRIRVDAPPAGPALSMAGGVEQIVDNLVDNALAVTPSGAAIEIAVRPDDRAVVLTIADRGPGMTADQIVRSFDRFWRAADADHPGTGLGLAVVQQLAEAGGGDVELAARDGGGLVATVRFSR